MKEDAYCWLLSSCTPSLHSFFEAIFSRGNDVGFRRDETAQLFDMVRRDELAGLYDLDDLCLGYGHGGRLRMGETWIRSAEDMQPR